MSEEQEINPSELTEDSPNEDKCHAYLEGLRWPDRVRCPRCGSDKISRIKTRDQLDCDLCRYRFSVTAGTVFHDTHLPLWKWFVAVNLIVDSDRQVSVSQIERMIGVSYKTAWYLRYRIRNALAQADAHHVIKEFKAAETFGGGGKEGKERGYRGTKTAVGEDADTGAFCIGEWPCQGETENYGTEGKTGKNWSEGQGKEAGGDTNSADSSWSLSNHGIGALHQVSDECLVALLHAMTLYFGRQENPTTFRNAMCKLLTASNLPYKK